ncbi:MAG: hypothetical protein EOP85_01475 [Verrucomicrobiaceae bacterium]|nr:MAG: hypothetical protein EOP85_01475 [Verrucomicrobiaceae bacterium]
MVVQPAVGAAPPRLQVWKKIEEPSPGTTFGGALWAMKFLNFDHEAAGKQRLLELNELDEFRHEAFENARIYKEKTKAWHDKHIVSKEINPGQQVLLYNSRLRLFPGKLKSRWSGPFTITKTFASGMYELESASGEKFMVNGQRVKPYYGGVFDNERMVAYLDIIA